MGPIFQIRKGLINKVKSFNFNNLGLPHLKMEIRENTPRKTTNNKKQEKIFSMKRSNLCLSREVTRKKMLIVTQSWYDSIERFFKFHSLLLLKVDANLTGLILFNFETTPYKNHSDTNPLKSIKRLLRYCHFYVLRYC